MTDRVRIEEGGLLCCWACHGPAVRAADPPCYSTAVPVYCTVCGSYGRVEYDIGRREAWCIRIPWWWARWLLLRFRLAEWITPSA